MLFPHSRINLISHFILNLRRKFYSNSFSSRTAALWKRLPCGCFPKHYNLNLFQSRISCYLSSWYPPLITYFIPITCISFIISSDCLSWVSFQPCIGWTLVLKKNIKFVNVYYYYFITTIIMPRTFQLLLVQN